MEQLQNRTFFENEVKDQMLMTLEAHNNIWQFPPERIVRMLSPKTLRPEVPSPPEKDEHGRKEKGEGKGGENAVEELKEKEKGERQGKENENEKPDKLREECACGPRRSLNEFDIETDAPAFQAAVDSAWKNWEYDVNMQWVGASESEEDRKGRSFPVVDDAVEATRRSAPDTVPQPPPTAYHVPLAHLLAHCVAVGAPALRAHDLPTTPPPTSSAPGNTSNDGSSCDDAKEEGGGGETASATASYTCEVKSTAFELVEALSAVCFDRIVACPDRTFVLTLGYECDSDAARWMIWHRKGVSATTAIRLRSKEGQKAFLRVVMCTLMWREPRHFGFPGEAYEGIEERLARNSAEANTWIWDAFWESRQASLKHTGYKVLGTYF